MPFLLPHLSRRRRRRRPPLPARGKREAMAGERRRRRKMIDGVNHIDHTSEGINQNMSVVLDHIHDYYKTALDWLPPELIPRLLEAGFCFGFLDPVSNIIANTISCEGDGKKRKRSQAGKKKGKRMSIKSESETPRCREMAISKIITRANYDIPLVPRSSEGSTIRSSSIVARSLRGLVTFLTCYFRYLTTWEALRYLRRSKADLLVAVRLIKKDHGMDTFTIHYPTAEIALACAAISAVHTGVSTFVSRSFSLAYHLDEVSNLLATQHCLGTSTITSLSELFTKDMEVTIDPRKPMQLAAKRLHPRKWKTVPVGLEISLRRVLLDRIHGLYLTAISSMPKHDLCSRHHRGLLKAGHCYGPFDPVTNIILNSIWYDSAFPAKEEFGVDMICTQSLVRIECLSLRGLVSFIRSLFPALSTYDAMRYLLVNNAELHKVIMKANQEGHGTSIPYSDAYEAAALAACHPNPTALVHFASAVMPVVGGMVQSSLKVKRMLSSDDVHAISSTLSQNSSPCKSVEPVEELTPQASLIISEKQKKFEAHQSSIRRRVGAALHKYALKVGHEYELHAICGVAGIPEDGRFVYSQNYDGCPYSHINIWARQKGSQFAYAVPTLFFIECSNDDEDMKDFPFLCCPVSESSKDAGRCFHCEFQGTKIVHPPSETYIGRCRDFEDMARGEHRLTNEQLTQSGLRETILVHTLEDDDCIYFDPAWDVDFAKFINESARRSEEELRAEEDPSSIDFFSWSERLKTMMYQELLAAKELYYV